LLAVDETLMEEVDAFALAVSDFELIAGCSDDIIIPKNPDIYFTLCN
jgi:hypothetical protein